MGAFCLGCVTAVSERSNMSFGEENFTKKSFSALLYNKIRIFEANSNIHCTCCEKYSSKLGISRSFVRIFEACSNICSTTSEAL